VDEERLARGLRGEDPEARRELLDAYGDRLLRSAFLLCGHETDAQDLVQETFLQGVRSAHRFRGCSTVYTWLHAILLNLIRHYHRDRRRVIYEDELANREIAAPAENLSRLDIETTSAALADALRQLSGPHREVLILRYYENMKIHEMARHLGISKGTVKSRLHYAIGQMRRLLPNELNLFGVRGTEKTERP
jgi:RNA polymerase sigma-70 factor (ECF subfamily)